MGFSLKKMFSGSGWRKFKRTVGGVASIGLSVVPGVGGLAGKLLTSKGVLGGASRLASKGIRFGTSTAKALRAMPTMPGGSVATPSGVQVMDALPAYYGGRGGLSGYPKRRRAKRRSSTRTASRKRRGRRLKFGSPAWRKKYARKRARR